MDRGRPRFQQATVTSLNVSRETWAARSALQEATIRDRFSFATTRVSARVLLPYVCTCTDTVLGRPVRCRVLSPSWNNDDFLRGH